MHLLSKSDFKLGRTCPTKLFYKKMRYPSAKDENAYLKLLAEGGYMIEHIARLIHPNGVEVPHDGGTDEAVRETQRLLAAGYTELFEPTFVHAGRLVRVDVFRKFHDTRTIELIEVKAKSWDSGVLERPFQKKRGGPGIIATWDEYIADVAYQTTVLRDVFPEYRIIPYLMMPDKAKTTSIDLLYCHFHVTRNEIERADGRTFTSYDISYQGDLEALRNDHFLTKVNVEEEVAIVEDEVHDATARLLGALQPELSRPEPNLCVICNHCEYRTEPYAQSGFGACWGTLGEHEHHLFDLRNGTQISGVDGKLFDEMIARGATCLLDIDESDVCGKNGVVGARSERQLLQIRHTRAGTEYVGEELGREMSAVVYPLHFIDFETSSLAIPYHAGMRPYEQITFQWSCHTIEAPGVPLRHNEWLHGEVVTGEGAVPPEETAFPNFEFARTLREQIGDAGTVLIWSHHEQTMFKHIRRQMDVRPGASDDLKRWVDELLASDRILDMEKLCAKYYFHPRMKGKTSIKNVCDAVWQTNPSIRRAFPDYVASDGADGQLSPYVSLPPAEIEGATLDVSVGTDAVRAYESMMYGVHRDDPAACAEIRAALLRYCKLDTAAMVMIWQHWIEKTT